MINANNPAVPKKWKHLLRGVSALCSQGRNAQDIGVSKIGTQYGLNEISYM